MFNVTRPIEEPASLSSKVAYDSQDVYDALLECFHKKCYLCECIEPLGLNIEHFQAHKGDKNKKFSWKNLYLACSRCNNIKLAQFDNLIDCCDPTIDASTLIKMAPPRTPYTNKVRIEATNEDVKTITTAELLNKIFNSDHTINKEVTGSFLRRKVYDQLEHLNKHIRNYFAPDATLSEKNIAIEKMKILSAPQSEFSAFAKNLILEDEHLSKIVFP